MASAKGAKIMNLEAKRGDALEKESGKKSGSKRFAVKTNKKC
jgi:hypothetical protein